jgi:hypothetical protein
MSLVLQNGKVVGSANINVLIGGVVVSGIRSINFKKNSKKENIYGFGNEPVGRGRAQTEYPEGTIEILLEEYKAIVNAAPNRDITQIPMFNIPIVFDNGVLPSETLNNVEFLGDDHNYKSGDAATWVTVPFIYAGKNS